MTSSPVTPPLLPSGSPAPLSPPRAATPPPKPAASPFAPLGGGNPLLWREVKSALRNVRAFALLAIYVAILGAVVVSQFPSETNVDLQDGGTRGRDLFFLFVTAQALMVVLLLPSLAVGALAQERERQTLQPLLMSPLTPLQIVWGKAGGALALAFILLLATLPLTSLCFLLGGISPGELLASYAALLGLSLVCIGVGLYCAAHWRNTTQATLFAYLILPPLLGAMALFSMPGIVLAGVVVLAWIVWALSVVWKNWETSRAGRLLRLVWWPLFWILAAFLIGSALWAMIASYNFGWLAFAVVFIVPYMGFAAQIALQQAAREIAQNPDPDAPKRVRAQEIKAEWRAALAPPIAANVPIQPLLPIYAEVGGAPLTAATSPANITPGAPYLPQSSSLAPTPVVYTRPAAKPTYGVEPFLSERLNPVFAREMRSGLAGKAEHFFRFGYIATILTEVLLLGWMSLQMFGENYASDSQVADAFGWWAKLHLCALMIGAAWLGARAFAPEREGQTLPQLLTVPMPAQSIAWGKFAAVGAQTGFVFLLGAPLALLLPLFGFLSLRASGLFFAIELACGCGAAAWGLWCSMRHDSVRRALGWALSGVAVLLILGPMFGEVVLRAMFGRGVEATGWAGLLGVIWPTQALGNALQGATPNALLGRAAPFPGAYESWPLTVSLYSVVACLLFALTALAFRRYARNA